MNGISVFLTAILILILNVPCYAGDSVKGARPEEVVIASVNGDAIYKTEAEHAFAAYMKTSGKSVLTDDEKQNIVKNMIRRKLILSIPEVQNYRKEQGVINQVREFENNLIIGRYLNSTIGAAIQISDEQLKEYYDKNLNQFVLPPMVEARHILLRNRDEAEKVLVLLKNGDDFSGLARQYSIDLPMAREGGSMGTIKKGKTLPALEQVLFTLEEGQYSDIVETDYGFHIIMIDKIHSTDYEAFENVKESIRRQLIRSKESEAFEKMARELEKNVSPVIYYDRL
jgi:peptidyl-prolyl cis-trans isomerase C